MHLQQRLAVDSAAEALGPHHPTTASAMIELGDVARRDGLGDEAEIAYRRALAILQTQPSPDRAVMARVLVSMGELFLDSLRYDDADAAIARADALFVGGSHHDESDTAVQLRKRLAEGRRDARTCGGEQG